MGGIKWKIYFGMTKTSKYLWDLRDRYRAFNDALIPIHESFFVSKTPPKISDEIQKLKGKFHYLEGR